MILFNRYPGGKGKCLTLSYDDGTEADRRFIEIINQYGIRATFHLNSGFLDRPGFISATEVPLLYQEHEVALHSVTHPTLARVPLPLALKEVQHDREKLETLTGSIVRGMSYPNGSYNEDLFAVLKSTGVCYSRTVKSTYGYEWPDNFHAWHPTCHHGENSVNAIRSFMKATDAGFGALFYLWGHSYEFEKEQNWTLLEDICKAVTEDAGKAWCQKADNVWLATNIEVYDYITAVRNLIVSIDGTILFNPSALSVWVEYNKQPLEIPPGETVKL